MFLQNYRNTSGIENLRALILLKPVRLFYFVHASVTMLMLIPSISASTSAQEPRWVPVQLDLICRCIDQNAVEDRHGCPGWNSLGYDADTL